MYKLPKLSGDELVKYLVSKGFKVKRQKGSHVFMEHPHGRTTAVPIYHANIQAITNIEKYISS